MDSSEQTDSAREIYRDLTTDELLRMHAAGTLTEVAYDTIEDELASRGVPVPARPLVAEVFEKGHPFLHTIFVFIKEYWQGTRSLSSAFWKVGVAGNLLFFILSLGVAMFANLLPMPLTTPLLLAYLVVLAIWHTFVVVSIWRCAKNTKWIAWTYVARAVVVWYVINLVLLALQVPDIIQKP